MCVPLYKKSCYQWSVINSLLKLLNCMSLLILSGGLKVPLMPLFSCSDEFIINTLKDFVETFYSYDFTGLVADISSDKESDFEIDLSVEEPTKELVNDSVVVSDVHNAPSASDKTTRKLFQGENNVFIVIKDDQIKYIDFEPQMFEI